MEGIVVKMGDRIQNFFPKSAIASAKIILKYIQAVFNIKI